MISMAKANRNFIKQISQKWLVINVSAESIYYYVTKATVVSRSSRKLKLWVALVIHLHSVLPFLKHKKRHSNITLCIFSAVCPFHWLCLCYTVQFLIHWGGFPFSHCSLALYSMTSLLETWLLLPSIGSYKEVCWSHKKWTFCAIGLMMKYYDYLLNTLNFLLCSVSRWAFIIILLYFIIHFSIHSKNC